MTTPRDRADIDASIPHAFDALELAVRWRTPPALFAALDAEFHFAIDAAADADSTLCADWLGPGSTRAENALLMDEGILPGPAFLNFPYSTKLAGAYNRLGRTEDACAVRAEAWVQWAAEEGQYHPVVGLVPASWDAKWWVAHVWGRATEIRCLDHRIQFLHPATGEPGTQPRDKHAIVIWRPARYVGRAAPVVRYWDYREAT